MKQIEQKDYEILRDQALSSLQTYMDSLPINKGTKLAYWVKDYARFLNKETSFDPQKLIRYKRGSIVKVHLGYRIGSEEGGLHYAVVMDNANNLSSNTATVIPLTSVKPRTDISHLHASKVYLGSEIYTALKKKCVALLQEIIQENNAIGAAISEINAITIDPSAKDALEKTEKRLLQNEEIRKKQSLIDDKLAHCKKMISEIEKMKQGSIALIGQITTVSKIRIYDPLYPSDVLSNIRLSPTSMDILDAKIKELFTYQSKT